MVKRYKSLYPWGHSLVFIFIQYNCTSRVTGFIVHENFYTMYNFVPNHFRVRPRHPLNPFCLQKDSIVFQMLYFKFTICTSFFMTFNKFLILFDSF